MVQTGGFKATYKGEVIGWYKTAKQAQVYKKQAELGEGWTVKQFRGRPFYVVRVAA